MSVAAVLVEFTGVGARTGPRVEGARPRGGGAEPPGEARSPPTGRSGLSRGQAGVSVRGVSTAASLSVPDATSAVHASTVTVGVVSRDAATVDAVVPDAASARPVFLDRGPDATQDAAPATRTSRVTSRGCTSTQTQIPVQYPTSITFVLHAVFNPLYSGSARLSNLEKFVQ